MEKKKFARLAGLYIINDSLHDVSGTVPKWSIGCDAKGFTQKKKTKQVDNQGWD